MDSNNSTLVSTIGKYVVACCLMGLAYPFLLALNKCVKWFQYVMAQRRAVSKLPGIDGHWLWGHLMMLPEPGEKIMVWASELTSMFPYLNKVYIGWWQSMVALRHPDPIKKILKTSEPKPMSGGAGYNLLIRWLGDGLLVSSGQKWQRNRKLLTPGFHFDVLKPYVAIYNKAAETLIRKWEQQAAGGGSIEIYRTVSLCTLDVMLKCAFTYDGDVQSSENKYVNNVTCMTEFLIDRGLKPWLYPDFIYYRTENGRKFAEYCNYAHKMAYELITKRQKLISEQHKSSEDCKRYVDFLDILLLAKDEHGKGLTFEEIREEVDTFLFEGHDTTASAITWILYLLAKHTNIQEKCRTELSEIISNGESFQWDHLQKIPYLTKCVKEGLRLYPPVPIILRELTEPLELHGVSIPPGTRIVTSIFDLHRNPLVWGDDHDEFKPDRFSAENMQNMDSHAFLPFSAGPRNCIGQNFAMHEIKVIVSRILMHFKLTLDDNHPVERLPFVTLKPKFGIKIFLETLKKNSLI